MSLRTILRSGYVRRFHANPELAHLGDTVAHHHAMVAQIVMSMHPAPSVDLIRAALHHDCGELMVGDLPAPFKDAPPLIAAQHGAVEDEARAAMGLEWHLTGADQRWLRFADRLAAYVHVRQVAPGLLAFDGWPEARAALDGMARALGDRAFGALCTLLPSGNVDWQQAASVHVGSVAELVREVCAEAGLPEVELRSHSRRREAVRARQRVMYLASLAGFSTTQIGRVLKRDHTTVLHGIAAESDRVRHQAQGTAA